MPTDRRRMPGGKLPQVLAHHLVESLIAKDSCHGRKIRGQHLAQPASCAAPCRRSCPCNRSEHSCRAVALAAVDPKQVTCWLLPCWLLPMFAVRAVIDPEISSLAAALDNQCFFAVTRFLFVW